VKTALTVRGCSLSRNAVVSPTLPPFLHPPCRAHPVSVMALLMTRFQTLKNFLIPHTLFTNRLLSNPPQHKVPQPPR
jgi:hypothetical protein